jgi:hypothetical protein
MDNLILTVMVLWLLSPLVLFALDDISMSRRIKRKKTKGEQN